ncbi:Lymphocyte expansion molecule [Taenia crassiceps]|uniref:Lymphocyte expansion molecule n=1 Tax=Taenia crassiceps TaxID=6207 RepID=A0ABR4QAB8_9CEST
MGLLLWWWVWPSSLSLQHPRDARQDKATAHVYIEMLVSSVEQGKVTPTQSLALVDKAVLNGFNSNAVNGAGLPSSRIVSHRKHNGRPSCYANDGGPLIPCAVIRIVSNQCFLPTPKEPTSEFKYNPGQIQCLGANTQNRSKTPYVLFSSRQHQWEQDWGIAMPRISFAAVSDAAVVICPSVNEEDDPVNDADLYLADLEPQEKPPKCPWVPPCGAAFGTKAERIMEKKRTRLRDFTNQPPPGAYDPYKDKTATKTNRLGLDSWTLDAVVDRAPTPKEGVGPACYTLKAPMDQELEDLKKRCRTFDSLSEERLAPIKYGYFARDRMEHPLTENASIPSFVEIMQSERNKKKGVFSKVERFPKKYGERCCLNAPGYNIDKDIKIDRGQYKNGVPQWKSCKIKYGKVPPGSRFGSPVTQREYNRLIGNVTPFTGPGRYDPYKYERKPTHRYSGLAKATERTTDPDKEKNWADRLRPTKATEKRECGECREVFVGSHVKLC